MVTACQRAAGRGACQSRGAELRAEVQSLLLSCKIDTPEMNTELTHQLELPLPNSNQLSGMSKVLLSQAQDISAHSLLRVFFI